MNEESTGGIMFLPDTHETKGSVEGVCVDIEASSSGPAIQFRSNPEDSTDSLSCCEALDWQENQNKGAGVYIVPLKLYSFPLRQVNFWFFGKIIFPTNSRKYIFVNKI